MELIFCGKIKQLIKRKILIIKHPIRYIFLSHSYDSSIFFILWLKALNFSNNLFAYLSKFPLFTSNVYLTI
jgi:hypothetical protein